MRVHLCIQINIDSTPNLVLKLKENGEYFSMHKKNNILNYAAQ